jgi:hypothetical protein
MDKEKLPVIFRPRAVEASQGEEPEISPKAPLTTAPETEMTPEPCQTEPQASESAREEPQGWLKKKMRWINDLGAGAGAWWGEFLSGIQERVSTGAVLAVVATILVMVVYGYYAFYLRKDLGDNLTALAQTLLAAGFGGFAATEITKIRRGP